MISSIQRNSFISHNSNKPIQRSRSLPTIVEETDVEESSEGKFHHSYSFDFSNPETIHGLLDSELNDLKNGPQELLAKITACAMSIIDTLPYEQVLRRLKHHHKYLRFEKNYHIGCMKRELKAYTRMTINELFPPPLTPPNTPTGNISHWTRETIPFPENPQNGSCRPGTPRPQQSTVTRERARKEEILFTFFTPDISDHNQNHTPSPRETEKS